MPISSDKEEDPEIKLQSLTIEGSLDVQQDINQVNLNPTMISAKKGEEKIEKGACHDYGFVEREQNRFMQIYGFWWTRVPGSEWTVIPS